VKTTINKLKPEDFLAKFTEKPGKTAISGRWVNSKSCELRIIAKDGKEYDQIGMTIVANVAPCEAPAPSGKTCGEIGSHFDVGQRIDHAYGWLLTSATVSGIPSYNRLPDGQGYRAIRGQFLGTSAISLIEALNSLSFDIEYKLNFTEKMSKYIVPTTPISEVLDDFKKCIGSTHFY